MLESPEPEERKAIDETAHEEKMTYPGFLDSDSSWSKSIGVNSVPHFALFGKDGRLILQHHGRLVQGTPIYEQFVRAIETVL